MSARLRLLGVAGLWLALAGVAGAQEESDPNEPRVADWAPRWEVGDWWIVRTFQRDRSAELSSPAPAEGARPRLAPDPLAEPLPGFPPLRNGVPVGYKAGNRFRFEVLRQEEVRYEDDRPGTPPEAFWVVRVDSLEGPETRSLELWFAVRDLALSKTVRDLGGKRHERWLPGAVQLDCPDTELLGCPLDWPNLQAALRPRAEFRIDGRPRLEQRVRVLDPGTPDEEVRLLLRPVDRAEGARVGCLFVWQPGKPFWLRAQTRGLIGELEDYRKR